MCSFIAGFAQTFPTEMNLRRVLFYINTEGYLARVEIVSFCLSGWFIRIFRQHKEGQRNVFGDHSVIKEPPWIHAPTAP